MAVRSSAGFGLSLVLLLAHPAWWFGSKESAPSCAVVRADDVSDRIDSRWQEFSFVLGEAAPCSSECSTDLSSEELGDNFPPWTFRSTASCLLLLVTEGYGGGHAVFEVFNNGVSLGNTTDVPLVQGSEECLDSPASCYFDPKVTKGSFTLQKDVEHSIEIVPRRADRGDFDGGWFLLRTVACDDGPACSKARSVCAASSAKCCSGLVCRKSQATSGQPRCLACARAGQYCAKSADCCSKKCLKRTKRCAAGAPPML